MLHLHDAFPWIDIVSWLPGMLRSDTLVASGREAIQLVSAPVLAAGNGEPPPKNRLASLVSIPASSSPPSADSSSSSSWNSSEWLERSSSYCLHSAKANLRVEKPDGSLRSWVSNSKYRTAVLSRVISEDPRQLRELLLVNPIHAMLLN